MEWPTCPTGAGITRTIGGAGLETGSNPCTSACGVIPNEFAIVSTTATAFTVCHPLLIRLLIFVFITYYLFAPQEKVHVIARVRTTSAHGPIGATLRSHVGFSHERLDHSLRKRLRRDRHGRRRHCRAMADSSARQVQSARRVQLGNHRRRRDWEPSKPASHEHRRTACEADDGIPAH